MNPLVLKIKELLAERKFSEVKEIFKENRVVDMAELFDEFDVKEILTIFKLLDKESSARLFTYMSDDKQEELIKEFSSKDIQDIFANIYSDDIVDMLSDLPANLTKKILQSTDKETRKEINLLLSFPEDSAGSIMSCDYFELIQSDTVGTSIDKLKKQGNAAETINTCYIIDLERRLVGSIELKDLLFENKKVMIKDIMQKDPVCVETLDDQEQVAKVMRKYDVSILPVVNDEHRMIGIITADDIMDIMEEEVTEDIHKMNAVNPLEDSYPEASVLSIVKSRLPWLLVLMLTSTLNSMVITRYENAISLIPVLVGFMPVIMDTAGNGGGQSSTVVIRAIATGDVTYKDGFKVLLKELGVALICSAVMFIITFVRIDLFPSELVESSGALNVALTVSISMVLALIIGKIAGGLLPLLVSRLKLDPASVASPIITTLADLTSLIIFFEIASFFFKI